MIGNYFYIRIILDKYKNALFLGSAFYGEKSLQCFLIEGITAQTIEGIGGVKHHLALTDRLGRFFNDFWGGRIKIKRHIC